MSLTVRVVGFLKPVNLSGKFTGTFRPGEVARMTSDVLEEIQKKAPGAAVDLTPKMMLLLVKSTLPQPRGPRRRILANTGG